MSKTLEKICLIIILGSSLLILLLPLFVYRQTLFPYVFSKMIVFRILVEIALAAWLILIFYKKEYRSRWQNLLIVSLSFFIISLFLASVLGVDFYNSFWSSQERMTGLLTMVHLFIWFIIISSSFKKWDDWRKLIWSGLFCSFLVGLYGLGQKIGIKSFLPLADELRMSSTLGNPIFLGLYSALSIFLSILIFLKEKNRILKGILIFLAFFNFIISLLAASRTVFIVLLTTLFILILYFIYNKTSKKTRLMIFPGIIFLIIIFVISFIFLQTQKESNWLTQAPIFIQRLANLSGNFNERMVAWQIAWQGFQERPLLGWGWENYNLIFNKYYQPLFLGFNLGFAGTWYDHSHNQIMDILSTAGILGIIAYLFFYGSIFYLLIKKIKKSQTFNEKIASMILLLMLIFYFIQNLTVFDSAVSLIFFYFTLGLIYFITSNKITEVSVQPSSRPSKGLAGLLILFVIISLIFVVYKINIEPFQQSKTAIKAATVSKNNLDLSLNLYKKALGKESFVNPEIRFQLARVISEQNKNTPKYEEAFNFAIEEMTKSAEAHPLNARYWLYLGQLYDLSNKPEDILKADEVLKKALKLSPKRQQVYFEISKNKILTGDSKAAVVWAQKAVDLDPNIGESYYILAGAQFANKQYKETIESFDKSYGLGYNIYGQIETYLLISSAYARTNDYKKAIDFIEDAAWKEPNNLNVLIQRIILYNQINDQKNVNKLLVELQQAHPELIQQIKEFKINNLINY